MKALIISAALLFVMENAYADFRIWTDQNGNTISAELVTEMGQSVCLKDEKGNIIKVPVEGLSAGDKEYITANRPPNLRIDLGRIKKRLNNYSYYYDGKQYYSYELRAVVKVENVSMNEPGLPLNMHVFFFSESDELVRHEHDEDIQFNNSGRKYEYETSAMTFYEGSGTADNSRVYGGYLVMITDSKNRVVATKGTNDKAEEKVDKLLAYAISKVKKDSRLPFRELQPYAPSSRL